MTLARCFRDKVADGKKYIYISCYSVHGGSCLFSVAVHFALYRLAVASQQTFNCARRVFNIDSIANTGLASSHYDNDKVVYKKRYIDKSVALCCKEKLDDHPAP